MKTCPSCHKTYDDETLVFCLDDGTRLVRDAGALDANATWNLPPPGPTVASPRPTSPPAQSTITAQPEQFQVTPAQVVSSGTRDESRRSVLPWVFAIVLVLGASGVLIAWFLSQGGGGDVSSKYPVSTAMPSAVASPSPVSMEEAATSMEEATKSVERATATPKPPSATPSKEVSKPAFTMLNNMTFDGSRITYYQRASFALCQADCAGNANCKGLTWIRPGAYNPNDPGMCYLMSALTKRIPHPCCISGVKN